ATDSRAAAGKSGRESRQSGRPSQLVQQPCAYHPPRGKRPAIVARREVPEEPRRDSSEIRTSSSSMTLATRTHGLCGPHAFGGHVAPDPPRCLGTVTEQRSAAFGDVL